MHWDAPPEGLGAPDFDNLLAVLLILPGALFAIVRATARGESELPDWPDLTEFGARLNEVFEFTPRRAVCSRPRSPRPTKRRTWR